MQRIAHYEEFSDVTDDQQKKQSKVFLSTLLALFICFVFIFVYSV